MKVSQILLGHSLFKYSSHLIAENLYSVIFDGLLSMLESREAGPLYGAATALRVLCFDGAWTIIQE